MINESKAENRKYLPILTEDDYNEFNVEGKIKFSKRDCELNRSAFFTGPDMLQIRFNRLIHVSHLYLGSK